jgi:hypothetical protein
MGGHVERTEEMKNSKKVIVRKPEGKRPLKGTGRDWKIY